jgi:vanillate O-demethylase monooxygenase subunit
MFVQNCWYPAGWDCEIGNKPLARTICGENLVLYRGGDGKAVALHDACPHRLLPLSLGTVVGNGIRCGYHGMVLDGNGQCTQMPGQSHAAQRFAVRRYPVVERYRFVWVWIGDAEKADPAQLPDFWFCEDPAWTFDGGTYHMNCNYQLAIDNLMDLTHETFVHPTSIGQAEIAEAPIDTRIEGKEVVVERWMHGIQPPPFWRNFLKRDGAVDRWQICRFALPAHVTIDVGVALAETGARHGDYSQGVRGMVVDALAPAGEDSCWYFWGMARNFDIADHNLTQELKASQGEVFREDVVVLEAQQTSIRRNPGARLVVLNIDAGGAHARRLIARELSGAD